MSESNPLLAEPSTFTTSADQKLGRANGNTYQRQPPSSNHDGQIMVRLKKKRFIVIDYGITPTPAQIEEAADKPYVVVPEGAGERMCATRDCPRIGVPVQLYDSQPDEPASLYLRGGLCFSCQRALNEKRRTQRKRKSEGEAVVVDESLPYIVSAAAAPLPYHLPTGTAMYPPMIPPPLQPQQQQQRYRLNGSILDLNPDAVIINGPIEGTRSRGPDYQYPRIGQDVLHLVSEIHRGAHTLLSAAYQSHSMGSATTPAGAAQINGLFQSTFRDLSRATYLITQWKASWDESVNSNGGVTVGGVPAIPPPGVHGGYAVAGVHGEHPQQHLHITQQQQQQQHHPHQQVNLLMGPNNSVSRAAGARPPQAQSHVAPLVAPSDGGGGAREEKSKDDLSDFYEEV